MIACLVECVIEVLVILAILLPLRRWVVMVTRIKGNSMMTTLHSREVYLAWSWPRLLRAPKRGQIILCHYPGRFMHGIRWWPQLFVKRIIALPGECIEIVHGTVLIDGQALQEPYLNPKCCRRQSSMPPRVLGEEEYFVMGDNRDNSNDSRSIGAIHRSAIRAILGRKLLRLPPLPKRKRRVRKQGKVLMHRKRKG